MIHLALLTTLAIAAAPACLPVAGSRILGRDLAAADSRYAALPSTLIAGFNAAPGMVRTFTAAELQRLAKTNGVPIGDPQDLCFALPMSTMKEEDAVGAMRRVLPPEAAVKILEIQRAAIPAGVIEFALDNLEPTGVWRGYVKYAETRKAPVWTRVAVTMTYTAVVAAADLPADAVIPAGALRLESRTGPPQHEIVAARIAEVTGHAPRHALKAGALIPLALLSEPPAVHRGDRIRVEVRSGPARLHFDAIAQGPARLGGTIDLRNPENGKTFRARVDSPSTAIIEIDGGHSF